MQKQGKSRKPLIVGIIAAVVILAVLLVLLLTQCTGGQGDQSTPTTESTSGVEDYQLYWNLDKAEYSGKSEAGLSSRMPAEDGFFYVRFFYEGEVVTLKVADRRTINSIDVQDLMGLEFDENGVVVGVQKLDDLPLEKAGWQFFVQSAAKTVIKLNSSESLNGMEVMLEKVDPNRVWDMSGKSGEPGTVDTPIPYDKVMAVQNLAGETTHVFIYDRPNYMATHMAYCQHCDKEVEWKEWVKTDDVPTQTGHYQLQNDIANAAGQYNLADETQICLDLNGYRIDGKKNGRMYRLYGAAISFALMDTSEAQTGVVAGHGTSDQGGLFWVTSGAMYMYGGTLDGSDMTTAKFAPVMAISKGAYFYMNGGHIIGGTAKPTYNKETGKYSGGYAGTIQCQGKFVMNGGIIEGGRAKATITYKNGSPTYNAGYGGNLVFSSGAVFEMNDGIIRYGKSDGVGGNIYSSATCEITMNGGSIQGGVCYGKGKNGGNIFMSASKAVFTMNGGSIVGGVSYNAAGNVYTNSEFIMNSGYIGSGALLKYGTGERAGGSSYNMMVVNGKLTLWGGTIVGGVSIQDSKADQKYQAQLNIYGWAKVHGGEEGKNLTITKNGDDVVVNVGTLYNGADIWVNASGIFTKPTKEANLKYFHSDVEGVDVTYYQECLAMGKTSCICGASQTSNPDAHDLGCNGETLFWGPWSDKYNLPKATGNYFLVTDVATTAQTTVGIGQDIKLDLNNHDVTLQVQTKANDGFRLYRVDDGSKLAITDTQAMITGKVGTLKTVMPAADAVYTGASFTYGGVTYEGQAAKDKAREIWDKFGNFGMLLWARGGYIDVHNGLFDGSNLTASQTGMIWHIASHAVTDEETDVKTTYYGEINFYNGRVITGNLTSGTGAIDVASGCALNIYGGTIENGVEDSKVTTRIYVAKNGNLLLAGGNVDGGINVAGNVTLSGAPVVGKEDGGLFSSNAININGKLADSAEVYTSKTGYITGETDAANKDAFLSTFEGLDIAHLENKLFAGKLGCLCNYGKTVGGVKVESHSAGCIAAMTHMGKDAATDVLQMSVLTKDAYTEMQKGGNWYLAEDLTMGDASKQDAPIIYLTNGATLVLDLNGKTLTINRSGIAFSTQNVNKEGQSCNLIITDTSAEQTGKIKLVGWSYKNADGSWTANQGGIIRLWGRTANSSKTGGYEYSTNTAFLLAGTLDASDYLLGNQEAPNGFAGAVHVHHSQTMHMYGGTIIGANSPYVAYSSAVDVTSGSHFNMYGGMIYGGNKSNVSVLNNTGRFTMSGGVICGGVNTTTTVMRVTGTAVINKELTPAGVVKPAYSLQIASGKALSFAGLTTGAEVYVTAGGKFGTNADAAIAALVKSDNPNGKVELDGTDLVMGYADLTYCECGGKLDGKYGHTCQKVVWKAWTSTNSLPVEAGNWYLTSDVNMTANVTVPKNVTIRLDLMGKKVSLATGIQMYKFSGNGKSTLVITDTVGGEGVVAVGTAGNGGIMDVGTENTVKIYNVVLDASGRTLTENGGVAAVRAGAHLITYNVTAKGGYAKGTWDGTSGNKKDAGVYRLFASSGTLAAGQLTVYGGTIHGGKATNNAGILYANNSNVVYFEGVTLNGGEAGGGGGAIMLSGNVQLTLKDCTITGAKAAGSGGALCLSGTGVEVTISGTTTITGNTTADGLNASNIYANGSKLIIADDFTGTIGLAGKTGVAIVDNITALDNKFITGGNIVLDDPSNYRFVLVGGKLGMEEIPPEPRMQCVCGGVLKGTDGHTCTAVEFQPWTSTNSLPTAAGNYFLNKNVGLSATATIGADVNIDLNGKIVSNANGIALNVTAGTVTITDSTATAGTISGGAGGAVKVSGAATLNLYAGTVTGGKANNGGGVSLTGTSKLNLAGSVQITDNTTADGSAANNVVADGGTMAFLPGFTGKVGIAGAYGKLVVTGITSESDPLLTGGNVALDDKSGDFKLVASAEGLTYSLANPDLKYACVCGGTLNGKYGHSCEKIFWEPWDKADSLPTATGNYYLTADSVTVAAAGTVAKNATVRLDLNGKTVNLPDNVQMYKFGEAYNSTLIITDTTSAPGSVIAVGAAGNGGVMDVNKVNRVEIYNVTLDSSARTLRENGGVATVRAGAHLVTYNVTAKGGTAQGSWNGTIGDKKDGGVYRLFAEDTTNGYAAGALTVYGGAIYGGTATESGGAVYANNSNVIYMEDVKAYGGSAPYGGFAMLYGNTDMTLKNCVIDGASATNDGGAIYVSDNASLTMEGVTIKNCTAGTYAGAVYVRINGRAELTDCTIEKCSSGNAGGAFYVSRKSAGNTPTLIMEDSEIKECTTVNAAGAIYMSYEARVTLNSTNITACTSGTNGGAIRLQYLPGSLTIGGTTTITGNKKGTEECNIAWNDAVEITLSSDFTGTIGVYNNKSTGVIPAITSLTDPRVGVNVVLDKPSAYAFEIYSNGLGIKAK